MELAKAATGKTPTKVALIGDNTAASVSFMKPINDHVLKDEHLDRGRRSGLHPAAVGRDRAGPAGAQRASPIS